jgi:transcriptional regulator with XRE-family HTH domain
MAATKGTSENSKRFGTQMAIARSSKRLSARQLEDRVKEIGGSISRGTIAKIESGGREVTLDEVLVLSAALDVGPFVLMWPGLWDPEDEVAIAGDLRPAAWQVAAWMAGFLPLRTTEPTGSRFTDGPAMRFLREFDLLVLIVRVTYMLERASKEKARGGQRSFEGFVEDAREDLAELEREASGPYGFPGLLELPLYRLAVEKLKAFDALH